MKFRQIYAFIRLRPLFAASLALGVAAQLLLNQSTRAESRSEAEPSEDRAAEPDSPQLAALLGAFSQVPGLSARFREEKRLALLDAPLISEGQIFFAPPDRLARHQRIPERSSVVLDGGSLTLSSGDGEQRIDLASQPLVAALVDSFRLLLAGRLEELRASYRVALSGDIERWQVRLEPLSPVLRKAVERIEIQGRRAQVSELHIFETSGDETLVRFDAVDAVRRFTPQELDALFRPAS